MKSSLTQNFVACALTNKGRFATKEAAASAVACALYELVSDGSAKLSANAEKVEASGKLAESHKDLAPVFTYVDDRRETYANDVIDAFAEGGEQHDAFMAAICDPMREAGVIEAGKSEKTFVPTPDAHKHITDQLVNAMDGNAPMTRDDAALLTFVLGAGLVDDLFGREERRNIERLLKDGKWDTDRFDTTPEGKDTFLSVQKDIEDKYAPMVRSYVAKH